MAPIFRVPKPVTLMAGFGPVLRSRRRARTARRRRAASRGGAPAGRRPRPRRRARRSRRPGRRCARPRTSISTRPSAPAGPMRTRSPNTMRTAARLRPGQGTRLQRHAALLDLVGDHPPGLREVEALGPHHRRRRWARPTVTRSTRNVRSPASVSATRYHAWPLAASPSGCTTRRARRAVARDVAELDLLARRPRPAAARRGAAGRGLASARGPTPPGSTTTAADAASASDAERLGQGPHELAQRGLDLGRRRRRRAGHEEQGPGLGRVEPAQVGAAAAERAASRRCGPAGSRSGRRPCRAPRGRGGRCARRPRARRRPRPRSPGRGPAAAAGWPPGGRRARAHLRTETGQSVTGLMSHDARRTYRGTHRRRR